MNFSFHNFQASLSNVLADFCRYGDVIQQLQGFIASVSSGGFHGKSGWDYCQTYQAFAETLSTYMTRFQRDLTAMEKKVATQGILSSNFDKSCSSLTHWGPDKMAAI